MTRNRSNLQWLVLSLAIASSLASSAQADPIRATYNTTGTIETTGISGTPVVSFVGVSGGTLTTGQPFSLGQFIVTPPPDGGTTTYGVTPFQIKFTVTDASGDPALPKETPITLNGVLDTMLNGSHPGQLLAIFDSTGPLPNNAPLINAYTYWITEGSSFAYGLHPTGTSVSLGPNKSEWRRIRGTGSVGRL